MKNHEPDKELKASCEAAQQLVRHLVCRGEAAVTIPMRFADEKFEIIVRHVPGGPIGTKGRLPWTLRTAVEVIHDMQKECIARGYSIALAGGVLHDGFSYSDLDLVAVPRTEASQPGILMSYLETVFEPILTSEACKFQQSFNAKWYSFLSHGRYVQVGIIGDYGDPVPLQKSS